MNENMKKVAELLKSDNTLAEKISAEAMRLAETMKDKKPNEILAQAIKNILGIDIPAKDLESENAIRQELTPDDMEKVAGGGLLYRLKEDYGRFYDWCLDVQDDIERFFNRLFG